MRHRESGWLPALRRRCQSEWRREILDDEITPRLSADLLDDKAEEVVAAVAVSERGSGLKFHRLRTHDVENLLRRDRAVRIEKLRVLRKAGGLIQKLPDGRGSRKLGKECSDRFIERQLVLFNETHDRRRGERLRRRCDPINRLRG